MRGSLIFSQLWHIIRDIMAEIQPIMDQTQLSVRSFFLLSKINDLPYPAQLAEQLLLPPPTVSLHLRELERLNYVKRESDQKDLRRYRMRLTEKGQQVLGRIETEIDQIVAAKCKVFSKTDQTKFEQSINLLDKQIK